MEWLELWLKISVVGATIAGGIITIELIIAFALWIYEYFF